MRKPPRGYAGAIVVTVTGDQAQRIGDDLDALWAIFRFLGQHRLHDCAQRRGQVRTLRGEQGWMHLELLDQNLDGIVVFERRAAGE